MNISEIYNKHSELVANETTILACSGKCNKCCYQLVTCSRTEYKLIDEYLTTNKLFGLIANRESKLISKWKEYKYINYNEFKYNPTKPLIDYEGKKCIFLNRFGLCDIYPVRPMNCRTVTSTKKCNSLYEPEATRFRFNFEKELTEKIWNIDNINLGLIDLFIGIK